MNANISTLICLNSRSTLEGICNVYCEDSLVNSILALLQWLQASGKSVILIWVSHCGIEGNQKADDAVRSATSSDPDDGNQYDITT